MIDFSLLRTPEEKLLVLFLAISKKPKTPKQIYSELVINKSNCCNQLRKLEKNGFIKKVTNEYGILLYSSVEQHSSSVEQHPSSVEQHPSSVEQHPSSVEQHSSSVEQHSSSVEQHSSSVEQHQCTKNSSQLTNVSLNKTKPTNKKKIFEREKEDASNVSALEIGLREKENVYPAPLPDNRLRLVDGGEKAASAALPPPRPTRTSLVSLPAPQPSQTNRQTDMPNLAIPKIYPKGGDFDGFIFAAALPREKALDRMLGIIGAETRVTNNKLIETKYELFRQSEQIIFNEFMRIQKGKQVYDDIVQRFAFAVAMEVPTLETLNELMFTLARIKDDYKSSTNRIYVWTPAGQMLRQIYFYHQWGWCDGYANTNDTWLWEKHRGAEPRIELFPSMRYQLEQEKKPKRLTPKQYEKAEEEKRNLLSWDEARQYWVKQFKVNPNNFGASTLLRETYGMTPEQLQMISDADTLEEALLITPNTLELVTA
jgi:hypothetical protein